MKRRRVLSELALVTCDCPANTGKLALAAGKNFVMKNPGAVEERMTFRDMKNMQYLDEPQIVVLQGCEKNCPLLRLEKEGFGAPAACVFLGELGYVREGTAEPSYADIEKVTEAVKRVVRGV
ncbi:MAG TPA: hypothetical protein O0X70_02245 [Methanocorpusculum sp.]|nr:hypothetical protein [Methanocorpusculum sp.]